MSLFDKDPEVERMKAEKDISGLIKALEHKDFKIRRQAVGALGEIGDPAAVEPLINVLKTESPGGAVQNQAVWALGTIGGPAVEPLIGALRDENRSVREKAADALGRTRDERAVQPLAGSLEDEYWPVRKAAVIALGAIGDEGAVEPLRGRLEDGQESIRKAAEESLHRLGRELNGTISPTPPDVDALVAASDVEGLIGALAYERDSGVRKAAAEALGNIGDPTAVGPLIAYLNESLSKKFSAPNPTTVEALAKLGAPAVEPLIAALETAKRSDNPMMDESITLRAGAADALGELGDPQAMDVLLKSLWDKIPVVRSSAAQALGKIGEPAVPRLIEILEMHGQHAPIATAEALKKIMGQDFRDDAAAWKQWWEEHGELRET